MLIPPFQRLVYGNTLVSQNQIHLARNSTKYCGVVTTIIGVWDFSRSAMGMPGSETALEGLTRWVLGDLLEEGIVVKLADDLYCDADTSDQLVHKPTRVLKAINTCNLKLSASKTVIVPHKTTILGWIWEEGTLNASPHRTVILSSCEMPTKVKAMHSFIGAYKVLVLYRVFVFSSFGGKHCWFTL